MKDCTTIVVRENFPPEQASARVGLVLGATLSGVALGGWLSGTVLDATDFTPRHSRTASKAWRVPFRSVADLRRRWPAIETAARQAEPDARRQRKQARMSPPDGQQQAASAAERRKHRYPVPDDAMPPLGPVLMTHFGPVVFDGPDEVHLTATVSGVGPPPMPSHSLVCTLLLIKHPPNGAKQLKRPL